MMGTVIGKALGLTFLTAAVLSIGLPTWPAGARGTVIHARNGGLARVEPGRTRVGSVKIYLIAIGDNGRSGAKVGCGDSAVAVSRPIEATSAPLAAAVRLLLSDHRRSYGEAGLYNALYQSRLRLRRAVIVNGKATVWLSGTMRLGGVCDDPRVVAQLRRTVRQFRTVRTAAIFINGRPLSSWLSEKGG